jgi:Flp pilus assembly protein TadG
MRKRKHNRQGNSLLEFTLVGIPLMFVLISIVEMSRGMWIYHSLAYGVKEGTRYTAVRGQNYIRLTGNSVTYQQVCNAIVNSAPGVISNQLSLTFQSFSGSNGPYTANNCPTTAWPPIGIDSNGNNFIDNQPGEAITITATYPFQSAISMFWPGKTKGIQIPTITFPAAASEVMQF